MTVWARRRTARSGELGRRSRDGHAAQSFRHVSRAIAIQGGPADQPRFPASRNPGRPRTSKRAVGGVARLEMGPGTGTGGVVCLGDSQHTPATVRWRGATRPRSRPCSVTCGTSQSLRRHQSRIPTLPVGDSDNGRRPRLRCARLTPDRRRSDDPWRPSGACDERAQVRLLAVASTNTRPDSALSTHTTVAARSTAASSSATDLPIGMRASEPALAATAPHRARITTPGSTGGPSTSASCGVR